MSGASPKPVSEETRRRMSESAKVRCAQPDWRSPTHHEPFCPEADLRRDYHELGLTQKEIAAKHGVTQKRVWRAMRNYGISARRRGSLLRHGTNNPNWKGEEAGYDACHVRVAVLRGRPHECSVCGTTDETLSYDWANLTGNYADPNDYQRMCRSCHRQYDLKRKTGC